MKIEHSPGGELLLHMEHLIERIMVREVLFDAEGDGFDLAARVGAGADWEDWLEWVAPDLREGFAGHLEVVATALERGESAAFPQIITIPREEFFHWFAAFNQARLALEEKYHFGPIEDDEDPEDEPPGRNGAFHRSRFYGWVQMHLLEAGL